MSNEINRRIVLASRPEGAPTEENFRIEETPVPEPGEGQMLCRTIYLSLDPYMRGRMNAAKSYAEPVPIDGVMGAGTVGQVVKSNLDGFREGAFVVGMGGWQDYFVSDGAGVFELNPDDAPISTALSVMGMPGLTAYVGLLDIGAPKAGETVVVAAAAGAVGSVVGQIARQKGCRVVGIAGAPEKCRYVVDELGFDASVSHRSERLAQELAEACPEGIDVYFENVGGKVFEAVMPLVNVGARIPLCGLIAHYNDRELPPGPNQVPRLMAQLLINRVKLEGFIIMDHFDRMPEFTREMAAWLRDGAVKVREDVVDGLDQAPKAFIGMLEGQNFGKLLVRVSADPTR